MKIEITINPESAKHLAEALAPILTGYAAPASPPSTPPPAPEAPAKAEKPAKAIKAEKPAAPAVTLEDLRAVATECVNAGKKDKLVEINKSFGATGLSKIEPDKYPEVLKALKALAAEAPEEDPCA